MTSFINNIKTVDNLKEMYYIKNKQKEKEDSEIQ